MSQKERSFQPKARRPGQKFGGKGKGFKPGAGRDFGDRSEGDRRERPERSSGRSAERGPARPARPYDRDARPPRDRAAGGDNPYKKREFGAGGDNRSNFKGDARPRRDFSDKPYKKREFGSGDSKPEGRGGYKSEGRRDYKPEGRGDFKPRKDFGSRDDRPRRDFGDKPYKKREFGGEESEGGFKPEARGEFKKDFKKDFKSEGRREFRDKKPFSKDKRFTDRPQKSYARFDDRPAKRDFDATKLKSDRPAYGAPSSAYLYGVHAVTQALLNPKRIHQRLLCTSKAFEALQKTWQTAQEEGIALPEVLHVEKEDIERLLPRDAVHQDILLDCQPLEEVFLGDILIKAADNAKVVVLDQVTDPHNVGAILRSAAAFGAIAVIMQKLHAPEITGTLAKSASGAVEHVPLVREVNLSRALEQLKEAGFFCIGLDEEGKQPLARLNLTGKTALVLGAEGTGLRRLVAENCDELVKLPTQEPIASLNVSNAAAVALYELSRAS